MEILLLIAVGLFVYLFLPKTDNKATSDKNNKVAPYKNNKPENISDNYVEYKPKLTETNTSLILKKGEVAYFEINTTLKETRAERRHQSVFLGKRNKNSTFFGGSQGRSKSHQVLTDIDSGSLILTNKRLVFDGNKTNRNIILNKIISIDINEKLFGKDELEISVENRQKSMYFSVPDAHKYKGLIMLSLQ